MSMHILYYTDLHGCAWKYDAALDAAKALKAEVVVNGGDLYPKNVDDLMEQRFFLKFLDEHFSKYARAGIAYLLMPGNDDLAIFDDRLDEACRRHENVHCIAQRKVSIGGHDFIGFNWVKDYPFRLKDRCRLDYESCPLDRQLGTGLLSTTNGLSEIDDWFSHVSQLPTLKDELAKLPSPKDPSKTILVTHMPPSRLGLDVCSGGQAVGSDSIRLYVLKTQPLLSLHGHIHESPWVSQGWMAPLGRTTCIQPGQMSNLCYVMIDTDNMAIERIEK